MAHNKAPNVINVLKWVPLAAAGFWMVFYGPSGDVLGAAGPFAAYSVVMIIWNRLQMVGKLLNADTVEVIEYDNNGKPKR